MLYPPVSVSDVYVNAIDRTVAVNRACFLRLSTWFVGKTFFETTLTYAAVANIVGLSYRPLRRAFLSAMPSSNANQRPRS